MSMKQRIIKSDDVESVIAEVCKRDIDKALHERLRRVGEVYHGLPYHVESVSRMTQAIIREIEL